MRVHRKVWIWWGRGWAVQFMAVWDEVSLGVRINWGQPVIDLYIGPVTIAFGAKPQITNPIFAECNSCRGFFVTDKPVF